MGFQPQTLSDNIFAGVLRSHLDIETIIHCDLSKFVKFSLALIAHSYFYSAHYYSEQWAWTYLKITTILNVHCYFISFREALSNFFLFICTVENARTHFPSLGVMELNSGKKIKRLIAFQKFFISLRSKTFDQFKIRKRNPVKKNTSDNFFGSNKLAFLLNK